jgi:hypothetical protein
MNHEGKIFIPFVTKTDLDEWRVQMSFVRLRILRGRIPNDGIMNTMEEIYQSMKQQFAEGEGIWVYS